MTASRDLHSLTIAEAARLIESRDLSPFELTRAYLERIEALNPTLGAYITVMSDSATAQARRAESEIARGDYRGPLHGVPVAVKDIIYTKGTLTSAGLPRPRRPRSRPRLHHHRAPRRFRRRPARQAQPQRVRHRRHNRPPLRNSRNPWNIGRSAGGSSSGSAVAVAGGLCAGSLGSDTGGSIRGPSAFCGIVGLRPTYGRVTRHGVVPMSWSLDTVGPMTRTVEDCGIMLSAIAGRDDRDDTSSREPTDDYADLSGAGDLARSAKVAVARDAMDFDGLDREVCSSVSLAAGALAELGSDVEEADSP